MSSATFTAAGDDSAERAQDAALHGYNGRDGNGAHLLRECAAAVRIAGHKVQATYSVPAVSAAERGDYTSELACRILGENGGRVPSSEKIARGYLIRRASGLILNDRSRRGIDMTDPAPEADRADPRLTGPLAVPAAVDAVARRLNLSQTGQRALAAAMVPATRAEWADYYGYADAKSWHVVAARGRAELYSIGEGAIKAALEGVEIEEKNLTDDVDSLIGAR